jgi:uncharacterized membrane protein YphA (DoxX/SURF4 family)
MRELCAAEAFRPRTTRADRRHGTPARIAGTEHPRGSPAALDPVAIPFGRWYELETAKATAPSRRAAAPNAPEACMFRSPSTPDAPWRNRLDRIDRRITTTLAAAGIPVLRISLGLVFLWFGVLKFFPGLSPAQDLAARTIEQLTFGLVPPAVALPVLAAWEVLIGLGLLSGRFLRATLLLLAVQMLGTLTPLVFFPAETFTVFPIAPTLEGQYILKNMVLVAAAMVVGATVRGGQLQAEPANLGEHVAATATDLSPAPPPSRPTEVLS